MAISMQKILKKFEDCNRFSLTGRVLTCISQEKCVKYNITEEDFFNAIAKMEECNKEEKRKFYENNKEQFLNYPKFEELYDEIKKECYDFDCEENRQFYLNKRHQNYNVYKAIGMTDQEINERMYKDFFKCSYIVDHVGKTTKYGNEHSGFFWHLYNDIAMMIDCQNDKEKYCVSNGKNPIEQIPEELKKHLLYYEVSFSNAVTTSSGLMINYYFKLNEETKKYLLKFRNDFCLEPLEDLAIYKDDELKFSSCTHEQFNSIRIDYKDMTIEDIADFINDKYFNEDNSIIVEAIQKIIEMPNDKTFSFQELNINDNQIISVICNICPLIGLNFETIEKQQTIKISRAIQLWNEGKYEEATAEMAKYQPIEGYYEPLQEEFKEDYDKEILFKKTQ